MNTLIKIKLFKHIGFHGSFVFYTFVTEKNLYCIYHDIFMTLISDVFISANDDEEQLCLKMHR